MDSSLKSQINDIEQKTTIELSNIKRKLNSELINKILEKIFSKKRTYNAIYTLRKENCIKNSGVCYINFINSIYILDLIKNLNEFRGKNKNKEINIRFAQNQGNEFIELVSEKRKNNINLDFIVFSDC